MLEVLTLTLPIFLLIGLGFVAVRAGWFAAAGLPALAGFVVRFALPALIFLALARRDFAEVLDARFLTAYALGSVVAGGLGLAASLLRGAGLERAAFVAMGVSCSNTAFIGFPLAQQFVGPQAGIALALCLMVENLLMIPLCLALAGTGSAAHLRFGRAFLGALAALPKNPLILAIAAGFACSLLGLPLPAPLGRAVELLSGASAAAALFYIGGTLAGLSATRTMIGEVLPVAAGKLLLHPLAVGAALWGVAPASSALQQAAVVIAAGPMLAIYPILAQRHGLQGPCAARMVGTTLAAFVSLSSLLWLLKTFGDRLLPGG